MIEKAMEPFGMALEDFYNGNRGVEITLIRDDGFEFNVPIEYFFRSHKDFTNLEKQALGLCKGKILDAGAGVGPHSLELQKLGFEVYAIDISSQACDIMKKRGIKNVQCTDFYNIEIESFDTILLLGRSIGFVENLNGIKKFLSFCKTRLNPKGKIILDSVDMRLTEEKIYLDYQEIWREENNEFYLEESWSPIIDVWKKTNTPWGTERLWMGPKCHPSVPQG